MTNLPSYKATAVDAAGNVLGGTSVEVRRVVDNSTTGFTLYRDAAGTTPIATNPFDAEANGDFEFYALPGEYQITLGSGASPQVFREVLTHVGQWSRSTRDQLAADLNAGLRLEEDTRMSDGTVDYLYRFGSTELTGMPNAVPYGDSVSPEHYQTNTTPGTTVMQSAVVAANAYAVANNVRLQGLSQYAFDERVNLDPTAARGELDCVLLPNYLTRGYTDEGSFALQLGQNAGPADVFDWDITYSGGDVHGNLRAGWLPSSGSFPTEYFSIDGGSGAAGSVPVTAAVSGTYYRVHNVGTSDVTTIGASVNRLAEIFQATGAGTGDGTLTPLIRSTPTTNDVFLVGDDIGTIDGVDFAPGDIIRATAASPSSSTFAGNWEKPARIYGVQINGDASPHSDFRIRCTDHDVGLHITGNTERINVDVSGRLGITDVWDGSKISTSTPDSNTIHIRSSSSAQVYFATGTVVSDVYLNTQVTNAQTYLAPCLYDEAGRFRNYYGIMRGNSAPVVIKGNYVSGGNTSTNVRWFTHLEFPMGSDSTLGGAGQHALRIGNVLYADVKGTMRGPIAGMWVQGCGASDILMTIHDPANGNAMTLGDTAQGTTVQGNIKLMLPEGGAGDVVAIEGQRVSNSKVSYFGESRRVRHLAGSNSQYLLQAGIVSSGTQVERLGGDAMFDFNGPLDLSVLQGYAYSITGMHAYLEDNDGERAFYDGTTWRAYAGHSFGSFTPTLLVGGTAVTLDAGNTNARYVRVGNTVTCSGRVTVTNLNGTTGPVSIGNLEFTSRNTEPSGGGVVTQASNMALVAGRNINVQVLAAADDARLTIWDGTSGTSNVTHNELTNSSQIRFHFSYETA